MRKENDAIRKRPIQYYASTMFIVILFVLLEIAVIATHIFWISRAVALINLLLRIVSLVVAIHIVNREYSAAYKLAWCIPILLVPLVGGIAYLIGRSRNYRKKAKVCIQASEKQLTEAMPVPEVISSKEHFYGKENIAQYLKNRGFCASLGDQVSYFDMADKMHESMLKDLENAERFIFLEYFIIQDGVMWDSILKVLKKKAAQGIDVRILYDGMGCIRTLPRNYPKILSQYHIHAKIFSPFVPVLSTLQNNRDHRKIMVIDGKVAYTGGSNLADEYINEVKRYGTWKDCAVRIEGASANSFTRFFLSLWNIKNKTPDPNPGVFFHRSTNRITDEVVIPYACSPLDDRSCAKEVYLQMIQNAKQYVYIMTPYLIPGEEILHAMKISAESGVDVRLITPSISDNRPIHIVTRSKYATLIESGVKVYEYQPGFIHSKTVVSDDVIATCGSINMDYRSLYLHFECGSVIFGTSTANSIKEDFLNTLSECQPITKEQAQERRFWERIYLALIRTFEPLL